MQKERLYCLVSGLVQGVGYRFFARKHANMLNVTGYAKNLWDGKVEVVAEGKKEDLLNLLEVLKKGPSLSQVKKVDARWEEKTDKYNDFSVL